MPFTNGDFVTIDYTARRASDKSIVYTTMEKRAKEEGVFEEEGRYGPQLIVIGKNNAIKGVEDAVKNMTVSQQKTVEIDPKDAFGERSEDLVRVMKLSDFREREIEPVPGMRVNIDGTAVTVKSVNSARVVVDANHPLAGEKLVYDITVVKKLDSEKEKVESIAEMYALKPDEAQSEKSAVKLVFGDKVNKDADYFINKSAMVSAIFRLMDDVKNVSVEERYAREEKKEK